MTAYCSPSDIAVEWRIQEVTAALHRRLLRPIGLSAVLALGLASPAVALETRLTELRVAGGSIRASLEVREMFPAKFQTVLEEGAAIYLRLQIELWEDRPVWDKLAQPAVVPVLRLVLDPSMPIVRVADSHW